MQTSMIIKQSIIDKQSLRLNATMHDYVDSKVT